MLHLRPLSATKTALIEIFSKNFGENATSKRLPFSSMTLNASEPRFDDPRFRIGRRGDRNAVERIFKKVGQQTYLLSNYFNHVGSNAAENWPLNVSLAGTTYQIKRYPP